MIVGTKGVKHTTINPPESTKEKQLQPGSLQGDDLGLGGEEGGET